MNSFEITEGVVAKKLDRKNYPVPTAVMNCRAQFRQNWLELLFHNRNVPTDCIKALRANNVHVLVVPFANVALPADFYQSWSVVRRVSEGVTEILSTKTAKEIFCPDKEIIPTAFLSSNPSYDFAEMVHSKENVTQWGEAIRDSSQVWTMDFSAMNPAAVFIDDCRTLHRGKYTDGKSQDWHAETRRSNQLLAFTTDQSKNALLVAMLEAYPEAGDPIL